MTPITLRVGKSTISGKGLFTNSAIPANAIILLAFNIISPNQWIEMEPVNFINHSSQNNLTNIRIGDKIYKHTNRAIMPGEELTTNYLELKQFNPPFPTDLVFYDNTKFYQEMWRAFYDEIGYNKPCGTIYYINKIYLIK